ncbi:sulfate respiration complex hexadecaheme cytochrome HmcA [Thermodesulfobacteriota bacterium]
MEKRRSGLKFTKSTLVTAGILILTIVLLGAATHSAKGRVDTNTNYHSDLLFIDGLKSFGPLERSGVVFLHDRHTNALEKENKDCKTCHPSEKTRANKPSQNYPSLKFKRLKDNSKQEVTDLYHAECIGCHKGTKAAGEKTGPIEICGQCHREKSGLESNRTPIVFDQSLHFRHTEANPDKKTGKGDCSLCHHEYDKKTKTLFYAGEQEGSCRYCHLRENEENRISMQSAAHLACISCHRNKKAAKKETGPITCGGCHDPALKQKIEKIDPAPRMVRKQPDIVLMRSNRQKADVKELLSGVYPVPFDHKTHETRSDTCIACHHASLDSCSQKCHTPNGSVGPEGSKEGGRLNLERAMHLKTSDKSCIGCHRTVQAKPECAACHRFIPQALQSASSCDACHVSPVENELKDAVLQATESEMKSLAEKLIQSRKSTAVTYADKDIPEKVTIKGLVDQYEPVDMPHRKMVRGILSRIGNSKLASAFHRGESAICQGCHHNSRASKKPPRCASCHDKPFDERAPFRPGLKAAYHQQCMGCHETLLLEKPKSTGCTDCHKKKG